MLYVKEETGEYRPATRKDVAAEAARLAKIQHLKPIINQSSALMEYLKLVMMTRETEQLRVIFVDNANRIIKDEVLSEGVENQTSVFPRQIMRRTLELFATGIIVVHNHPTGQLRPSNADIAITRALVAAADTLSVRMLDHVIIGMDQPGYFSFRENGMI